MHELYDYMKGMVESLCILQMIKIGWGGCGEHKARGRRSDFRHAPKPDRQTLAKISEKERNKEGKESDSDSGS